MASVGFPYKKAVHRSADRRTMREHTNPPFPHIRRSPVCAKVAGSGNVTSEDTAQNVTNTNLRFAGRFANRRQHGMPTTDYTPSMCPSKGRCLP